METLIYLLVFFFLVWVADRALGRWHGRRKPPNGAIGAVIEDPSALKEAESQLRESSHGKVWVTIASTSTHKGFREADLQGAISYLGARGIEATYRTTASAEGIQDFSLQVTPENIETAKIHLVAYLKK